MKIRIRKSDTSLANFRNCKHINTQERSTEMKEESANRTAGREMSLSKKRTKNMTLLEG